MTNTLYSNTSVSEGQLLWKPKAPRINQAQITRFMAWLDINRSMKFETYDQLYQWSTTDTAGFWAAIWDYFDILHDGELEYVYAGSSMAETRWFEGVSLNYAEHILRQEMLSPDDVALCHSTETRPIAYTSWSELGGQVRKLATKLRELGIVPGDRVVAYMPNTPEAVIAMLATVSIGAIWSSAAPEFGCQTVIDRFSQIAPKLAFICDGYSFGGKVFDRREDTARIIDALPDLDHLVWFGFANLGCALNAGPAISLYEWSAPQGWPTRFVSPAVSR